MCLFVPIQWVGLCESYANDAFLYKGEGELIIFWGSFHVLHISFFTHHPIQSFQWSQVEEHNNKFEGEKTATQEADDLTKATWLIVAELQRSPASPVTALYSLDLASLSL